MNDSVIERITKPANRISEASASGSAITDAEDIDNFGTFSFLRGVRDRAIMLELRRKNGIVKAIGYAWIWEMDFDASTGITLSYHGSKIRIIGRNLNAETRPNVRMFEGIARHRVPFVQEADQGRLMQAAESETMIERIEW